MRADLRAESACLFLRDVVVLLLIIAGSVWALLTWFEPCAAAALCTSVPLIRQPYVGRGPLWWQRWMLRVRLLRLRSRAVTEQHDIEFLQRELALTRNLLDDVQAGAAVTEDEIAWARSDLARLQ